MRPLRVLHDRLLWHGEIAASCITTTGCQKRRRERACKKANVPREWIERVVVKAALDYVLRPEVMEWIADAVMEYQEREAASAQLAALTAELEENRKATDNVMKAIEAGIITLTTKQRLLGS